MPNMRGDECHEKIKEINPNQIVIAVSSDGSALDKTKYLDQGFIDFVPKPFKNLDIKNSIEKCLEDKRDEKIN